MTLAAGTAIDEIEQRLRTQRLIAILRRMPEEQLVAVAESLIAGGVRALEVTMDSPGALDAIATLRRRHGDSMLVGAGTVMSTSAVEEAVESGAQFLVSPHLDVALLERARVRGVPFLPGVLTPSEIVQAERAGAHLLKLFPAGPLGPGYLADLLGPFRGRSFFVTGGITEENLAAYLRVGAAGAGVGSALTPREDVERSAWNSPAERARRLVALVRDVEGQAAE